jgi:hypothetical protein
MLHHTSGIRDKYALAAIGGLPEESYATDAGTLKLLSGQRTLNFPPGSRFMYTNSGYFLLAQVVARVSGCSFREFTQERIFGPLGMTSSLFRDDPDEPLPHRASGHTRGGDGWRLAEYRYASLGPGGAWSTADDLARWSAALDRDEPVPLERLLRTRALTNRKPNPYAFGLTVGEYRGHRLQQHAGGVQGHTADFLRFPDDGVAIVCFANGGAAAGELSRRAADIALGLEPAPRPEESPEVAPDVGALAGAYSDDADGLVLTIEDDVTVRLGSMRLPVRVVGPTELLGPAGIAITVTGDELLLRTGGGDEMRFDRLAPPARAAAAADAGMYVSKELGASFALDVEDDNVRLSRAGDTPTPMRAVSDDLYLWTMPVLGTPGEIPVRILRDGAGTATALSVSVSRALDVRFTRRP